MNEIKILIKRVGGDRAVPLPAYQTAGSSGMDLACYLESPVWLDPQSTLLVSTGISLGLPNGYEAQIRPRSGLALKHGITLLNAPGTIDSDYRGIISVILINHSKERFQLTPGMRIAQLVIQKVVQAVLEETDTLDRTVRAAGGFGHTGV